MKNGWPLIRLSEVLVPVSRPERVDPAETYSLLGAHWYATGLYTKEIVAGSEIRADKLYRVEDGDFVYNRLFAWKGSFALATKENHGCYVSNEFPCFRVDPSRADGRFLWRYFSRASSWDEALGLSSGGTPTSRNRLKEERFLAMEIPLPPLAEQQRLVARIEALFSQIKEAVRLRARAAEASDILFESSSRQMLGTPEKPRWSTRSLQSTCSVFIDCDHKTPDYVDDGIPLLRPRDIRPENLTVRDAVRISEVEHEKRCARHRPVEGDIVYSRELSFGNAAMIPKDCVVSLGQGTMLVRADESIIEPRFLLKAMNAPFVKAQATKAAQGAAHPHVNLKDIRNFAVPVPPLLEQRRIVAELDALQAEVDVLTRLQAETATELDALLPSILDKAFKGEL
jgi:type I restriction enzyme, S subunit